MFAKVNTGLKKSILINATIFTLCNFSTNTDPEGFSVISTPGKTCNMFEKNKTKNSPFEENPGRM